MKKKILIAAGGLLVVIIAVGVYRYFRTPLSPPDTAEYAVGDFTVSVDYSRPSMRGRVIFGTEEEGALQPFGQYWRLGANAATEITFSKDVTFYGEPVNAGSYRMYAYPGQDTFELRLNSELGKSGSEPPDATKDILAKSIPIERPANPIEQFTIRMEPMSNTEGMSLIFEWADVRLTVPTVAQSTVSIPAE